MTTINQLSRLDNLVDGDQAAIWSSDNGDTRRTPLGTLKDYIQADFAEDDGASLVGFIQDADGAVARTALAKLRERVSVEDFGAVGDGATDDTMAIQTALNSGAKFILLSSETYKITTALQMSTAGQCLTGQGSRRTEIVIASTTSPAINLANGVERYGLQGFKLSRSGSPGASAHGIEFLGTTDNSALSDLWIIGHRTGLIIGTCDTGLIEHVRCSQNVAYGIYQTNSVAYGPSQWEMNDILVDRNGIDGIRVESTAGPAGLILGTWSSVKSFANTGRGIHLVGNATTGIYDLRLVNAFLGSDGAGCVRIDSYGGKHRLSGFFERAGRDATGPSLATPASNDAPGIEVAANNTDVGIAHSTIDDNAKDGILHTAGVLSVNGCLIYNNGAASVVGRRNGILSNGGNLVASGCFIGNLGGSVAQLFGIATAHDDVAIAGNDLSGNITAPYTLGATATANIIGNYPTQTSYASGGIVVGNATGGAATGVVNVSTDVQKNGTNYTNP